MNARAFLLPALLVAMSTTPVMARAQATTGATPFAPFALEPPWRRGALPQWRPLPGPSLQYHAAAYDSRRHRVIAFGGTTEFPSDYAPEYSENRTWALALDGSPTWSEIVPHGPAPSPRRGHSAIYDPVRDRLIVFGGGEAALGNPPYLNDVWALSLSGQPTWTRLEIAGALPPPRSGHCAIYDPIHDAMIVFGSSAYSADGPLNDTWSLSLSDAPAWKKLEFSGSVPPGLFAGSTGYGAVFDSRRRRMVLIGRNETGTMDAWALSITGIMSWARLTPSGTPPIIYSDHSCAYDPDGDRVIVFGGYTPGKQINESWELSLAGTGSWAKLAPVGPPPSERIAAVSLYDPRRQRMLVVGGAYNPEQGMDTWALSLRPKLAWSPLLGVSPSPSARLGHTAIYDSQQERTVIFGGSSDESYPRSLTDAWALSLTGDGKWVALRPTPWWMQPRAGQGHSAIYDPIRQRMLVFGGITDQPEHDGTAELVNELWSLSLASTPSWSKIDAAGEVPSPRMAHLAIYDPDGDRMIVFGGYDGTTVREDVWALSLAGSPTWVKLDQMPPGPGPRDHAGAVYDPVRKRMLMLGGSDGHLIHHDWWALSLVGRIGWSKVELPEPPPGQLLHDSKNDRLLIWNGTKSWTLALSGPAMWTEVLSENEPPRARSRAFYDSLNERIIAFGGNYDMNDTWALSLRTNARASIVRTVATADSPSAPSLGAPRPNPSAGGAQVEFTLSQAGRVSLAVFDAAGRRVRSLAEGSFAPGKHSLSWDGRDADGHLAPIGLYFMRLETGRQAITQKTVIAR